MLITQMVMVMMVLFMMVMVLLVLFMMVMVMLVMKLTLIPIIVMMLLILGVDRPPLAPRSKNENPPPPTFSQVSFITVISITIPSITIFTTIITTIMVITIFSASSNVKKLNFACYKTPIFQFQVDTRSLDHQADHKVCFHNVFRRCPSQRDSCL